MTREQLVTAKNHAIQEQKRYPYMRIGQLFYNKLFAGYPDEAEKIRGTEFDPFYIDENIDKCIDKLLEEK